MRAWLRKWSPVIKVLFGVAVVAAFGWHFHRDLAEIQKRFESGNQPLRVPWLVLGGALYLLGLGCSALFWYRLLRAVGQRPSFSGTVRAYYLGHFGKYLPGKAWALFLRAWLIGGEGVGLGIATLTSLYEVLTTMTGGVLLAAVILPWQLPDSPPGTNLPVLHQLLSLKAPEATTADRRGILLLIGGLLAAVGIPIIPAVFNRVVGRITRAFPQTEAHRLPPLRPTVLAEGLLLTAVGWLLLGASLWAVLAAVLARPPAWDWGLWTRLSGYLALAYVAGFVILLVPSGLGVREFFLTLFLLPLVGPLLAPGDADAKATVVLAVLLLRLIWTAAEGIMAGVVFGLPSTAPSPPSPVLASAGTDDRPRTTDR